MAIEPGTQPKPPETNRLPPWGEETVMDMILKFSADEAGVSAVEYAILLTFIALAIAGSVLSLGNTVRGIFENAVDLFPGT
jgi:Flp pilus assembly pilin Flp